LRNTIGGSINRIDKHLDGAEAISENPVKFRNLVLATIPAPDIAALFSAMHEVSFAKGEALYEAGEPAASVFFPSSAVMSAVAVMRDGRCVEAATIGYESVVGLLPALTQGTSTTRIFAQIPGGGIQLPADRLRAQAEKSRGLMTLLLRHADAANQQAEQSVACNALHAAPARLARWLLLTADRTGSATFSLTQDYMAIMMGAQRSTVSLVASTLKASGLIRYTRGAMEIVDRDGLEALACECYGVIRWRYEALAQG
jgi:CRP-like cAMP-binding protein